MELMACAKDPVSSPRAEGLIGKLESGYEGSSSGTLEAEKKSAEANMLQEEAGRRATTERLHEMANPPKKKAWKEGQKLTEDQKQARARVR